MCTSRISDRTRGVVMNTKNLDYKTLISDFITYKRTCGYKYDTEQGTLNSFYNFTISNKNAHLGITKNLIEEWCKQHQYESRKSFANRISAIRQLALYLSNRGYCVYTPKAIPRPKRTDFIPHIFTDVEISKIFKTLDNLPTNRRYNSATVYPVLFRILYGCGLRIGEALSLSISDVDTITGILTIRGGKFDKDRIVMMSESLRIICRNYRNKYLMIKDENTTFFQHRDGSARNGSAVSYFFREVLWKSGIPYKGKGKGPRLHDIRHTFCCNSLKQMSDNGFDMYCSLPILSVYVGHSSIKSTEKYLRLTTSIFPDLEDKISNLTGNIYPEVHYE